MKGPRRRSRGAGPDGADSRRFRIIAVAGLSLTVNALYAVGNLALGLYGRSYWFVNVGAYYLILAVMRFSAVVCERRALRGEDVTELFVQKFSGIMLLALSIVLCVAVYLSVNFEMSRQNGEIIMIAMAAYTFTKVVLAIINFVKRNRLNSHLLATIRCISLADAAVSVFSLQRSMLVSFGEMEPETIRVFNICTGAGVCVTVAALGLWMALSPFAGRKRNKKENRNGKVQTGKGKRKNSGGGSQRLQKDRGRRGGGLHKNRG